MIKNLSQAAGIIAMAFVLAIIVNYFRADGLPLTETWSLKTRMTTELGENMAISLKKAEKLFRGKKAIFIDARSVEDYRKAHIKGALSLPWHEVEQKFIKIADRLYSSAANAGNTDNTGKIIITYCDGETCNLSHDLAEFLMDAGFTNVKVLINGFSVWKDAKMPVSHL